MGLLDRFGQMTKKSFAEQIEAFKREFMPYEPWQLLTAEAERYTLPDPGMFGNQANLYRRLPAVFLAVDIVSSAAALTEFSVARVIAEKEPKDIPNHPFEMLLARPNPLDSRYEFLYATIAYWMLNKNSYWWLNRADELAPPDEMWVIPPHMITPVPDGNMFLKGYIYYPGNGAEIFMQPEEIIHFKGFNPFSRFVGLSAGIESLMLLAQSYLGMTAWNTKLYNKSNGRLPGILSFEQMVADPLWEKIKADTREAAENRDLLMLRGVGSGLNWQQAAATAKDMDFYSGLDKIDKAIMDVLAPGAYTMLFENANEANSRTGRATLNELAVYPKHVVMGEKITSGILPAYGSDKARPLVGRFKDIRVTDRQMEITEQQEYAKTHTIAEVREEFYGDDPLGDDRDELLPEQLKTYKSEADKELELEKQKVAAQNKPAVPGQQMASPQQEMMSAENKPPAEDEAQAQKNVMILENLDRYQRFALRKFKDKKIGEEFINDFIPPSLKASIHKDLQACLSETAVKAVFDGARARVKQPAPVAVKAETPRSEILALADSLNNAAAAYKAQYEMNATLAALKLMLEKQTQPQQIVVYPPAYKSGDTTLHIEAPSQTPQPIYNSFPVTVEAAKTPDVQISSPVHLNIEQPAPAKAEITTPVNIYQTVEAQEAAKLDFSTLPAPVTNVTVENMMPEMPTHPAPVVNIENKVEPTPITNTTNVNVEPTPIENKVEVKTPKVKRTRSKVARDEANNIDGQTTDFEYEDDK